MAELLLITIDDIKKLTAVSGNVDVDKILPFIKAAQDIHLQPLLGTALFEKLKTDAAAGLLAGDYETLVDDFIKPFLVQYALVDFLPFNAYEITNAGIQKPQSDNATAIDKDELNNLINIARNNGQFYGRRMLDFLCSNSSTLPEYKQTPQPDGGIYPDGDQVSNQWVL